MKLCLIVLLAVATVAVYSLPLENGKKATFFFNFNNC